MSFGAYNFWNKFDNGKNNVEIFYCHFRHSELVLQYTIEKPFVTTSIDKRCEVKKIVWEITDGSRGKN